MSPDKISQLEREQESQAYKIQSLEKTIDALFPPLIEQLKEVGSKLSANTEAVTKSTMAQEHLSADVKELKLSSNTTNKRINAIEVTQAANQVVINMVKGMGVKIFASTITIVLSAVGVVVVILGG